jgi:hypothetical protein
MLKAMLRVTLAYLQVFYSIIQRVTVFVVNDFVSLQCASKTHFHDVAMLQYSPSIDANHPVPSAVDASALEQIVIGPAYRQSLAIVRAEPLSTVLARTSAWNKLNAALFANMWFHIGIIGINGNQCNIFCENGGVL